MLAVHHTNYPKPTTTDSLDKVPKKKNKKKTEEWGPLKSDSFQLPHVKPSVKPKLEMETASFLIPATFFSHDSMRLSTKLRPI